MEMIHKKMVMTIKKMEIILRVMTIGVSKFYLFLISPFLFVPWVGVALVGYDAGSKIGFTISNK